MDKSDQQDSIQISEELQFVTACLIGQFIKVQTKIAGGTISGTLEAASFDKDYQLVLKVDEEGVSYKGYVRLYLKDIAYISAENVSLDLKKDAMLESCTKKNQSEDVTDKAQEDVTTNAKKDVTDEAQENVIDNVQSSAGQNQHSGASTNAIVSTATSSTFTGTNQMQHHPSGANIYATVTYEPSMATFRGTNQMESSNMNSLNSISHQQPMVQIMQPAQTGLRWPGQQGQGEMYYHTPYVLPQSAGCIYYPPYQQQQQHLQYQNFQPQQHLQYQQQQHLQHQNFHPSQHRGYR